MNTGYTQMEIVVMQLGELLYCLAYTYATWYFMRRNLKSEDIPRIIRTTMILILFFTSVLTLQQENMSVYTGCGMAILILLSGLFCHCSKAGIVETILFAMAILGSYLIFNMFLDFLGYGFGTAAIMTISTWYFLIRTAVYLILSLEYILISRYFVKVFREKAMVSLTNGQTVVFLVIPFLILLLLLAVYQNGDVLLMIFGYGSMAGAIFGIAVLHLLVIYLFGYMLEQQKKNLHYQLYEQQREMMMHQYQELEEKYQSSRKVIHDVRNHIQMIGELYHLGDLEAADRYCRDIGGMLRSLERVAYTKHRMLNLILNEKLNGQEMKGAALHIEIGQVDLSFMKDIDVTTIFSNLLDNAIEAVTECEKDRYLSFKMDEEKDFLVICLRNSCPVKRKKRRGHEGIGLVNVRYVVEFYGGTIQVSEIKGGYQTSIMIPIERGEKR